MCGRKDTEPEGSKKSLTTYENENKLLKSQEQMLERELMVFRDPLPEETAGKEDMDEPSEKMV